jgi:hypothetical protein
LELGRNDCALGLKAKNQNVLNTHLIHSLFAIIWLASATAFFYAAYDSQQNLSLALPQATASLDDSPQRRITFNDQDVSAVMDNVINAHNQEVSKLEVSLHDSASLTFKLNLLSGCAALLGFVTQGGAFLLEDRKRRGDEGNAKQED